MADTLDLLTLAEGYRAINDTVAAGAGTGAHDAITAQWITAISRRIDELCGPVVIRTVTNEAHVVDGGMLKPRKRPVSSITTITEYSGTTATVLAAENLTGGVVTGNDYYLDPATSFVFRRSHGGDATFASTRVVLTYQAGRAANTEAVDALFKAAAGGILQRMRNLYGGAWNRGGDPFAATDGQVGFFRAVDPIIRELLGHQLSLV